MLHFNRVDVCLTAHEKEALLLEAKQAWPHYLDTHIALYKFYFRMGDYQAAERGAIGALKEAAKQGGFNRNYRLLTPGTADWLGDHSIARLYLFTLKALGVIRLRRQRVFHAYQVLKKLMELDPYDEIGGSNFYAISENILNSL